MTLRVRIRCPASARRGMPSGGAVKTSVEDWPFNAPFDLHDPQYFAMQIGRDDFETAWQRAHREPQG
ncbi:hypothetical protein [Streptomyces sp. NPDC056549]|uniref:hypothetical protein n=1 Tax=Streptomyces sp. NPDC056549 TaxID=3345864 RepID=UPI0036B13792